MIKSTLPAIRADTVREPPRKKINSTSRPCFFQIPLSAATQDGAKPVASDGKPTRNASALQSPAELNKMPSKPNIEILFRFIYDLIRSVYSRGFLVLVWRLFQRCYFSQGINLRTRPPKAVSYLYPSACMLNRRA